MSLSSVVVSNKFIHHLSFPIFRDGIRMTVLSIFLISLKSLRKIIQYNFLSTKHMVVYRCIAKR